jgi:hypothetical protein
MPMNSAIVSLTKKVLHIKVGYANVILHGWRALYSSGPHPATQRESHLTPALSQSEQTRVAPLAVLLAWRRGRGSFETQFMGAINPPFCRLRCLSGFLSLGKNFVVRTSDVAGAG